MKDCKQNCRLVKKLVTEVRYEVVSKELPLLHASFPGKSRVNIRLKG